MITVIINVYNGEKYIKKCLDSVINQTYKNLEILIINDGSTDNTLDIVNSYKDKRIKVITTENKGLSLSRNVGIDNAKGEYLYFVDADDFIENDTIEYLYNLINKYDGDISTCKCIDIYNYNYKVKNKKENIEILSNIDMLKKALLTTNREVATWNKLYKKELFNNLRFEKRKVNDLVLTHKLVMKSKKIIYSNQIKYYYFNNKNSLSHKENNNLNRAIDRYKACIERYNYINKEYPNFIENDVSLMQNIARLYKNDKAIKDYLDKEYAINLFNKLFSLKKVFKCKIRFMSKIKLIIFKVNPNFHNHIVNNYLKLKG